MLAVAYQFADYAFFVLNVVIVSGYVAAALTLAFSRRVLPILGDIASPLTRLFGTIFFALAATTRTELAWHAVIQKPYLNLANSSGVPLRVNIEHAVQAVSIWIFLVLFAANLVSYKGPNNGH